MCYIIRSLVLIILLCSTALVAGRRKSNTTSPWKTLWGDAPSVIARGGFSGLFPDSSVNAYQVTMDVSVPDVILWCDVQLTKDGVGICFPDLKLETASNVETVYKNQTSTHLVNGVSMEGYFTVDFTFDQLINVSLVKALLSRSEMFDSQLPINTVDEVNGLRDQQRLWLNFQHDIFFQQHNLSMRSFILSVSKNVPVNYVSSPEVNFLRSIFRSKPRKMELVFRFLERNEIEPSTNQSYESLLNNLTFVKSFASGILVPKSYVWPVDQDLYLLPPTSVVQDAHKAGLQVFVSNFANDVPIAYNYSYNPIDEYLSFIDNGNFSVDGVVSDFPVTASEAIGCFSHVKNGSGKGTPLVISYNGASGDYPGCTDLAYGRAILDGVDFIDCSVQMTKDGIPICLGSIDLIDSTTVVQSEFRNYLTRIPELKPGSGIYTFNLTWSQIQKLTPAITNPSITSTLLRNPRYKNSGKLVTLREFLDLAKNTSSVSGVLINIDNAPYLAEKQRLSVTDAVLDALSEAGYNNQTSKKVLIQSTNSSLLIKIKEKSSKYERVYRIEELIRDIQDSTILDIKKFANSVAVNKASIFLNVSEFLTNATDIVPKLKAAKLAVYVQLFSNDFMGQAWDFYADATKEITSFVETTDIDGLISDFPATAIKYRRNKCLGLGDKTPKYMNPVKPGGLYEMVSGMLTPEPPLPVLNPSDVDEPPLPEVTRVPTAVQAPAPAQAAAEPKKSKQPKVGAGVFLMSMAILITTVFII